MNNLEYWFDIRKIADANTVKLKFQEMLQNTNNAQGRNLQNEIFEVIWNNNTGANGGLRGSLFPNTQNLPIPQWEVQSRQKFINMINTMDNQLFGFIKVK